MFFQSKHLRVVWEAAFMTKQRKHGKTDVEKGKGTKTKKNADRFGEITRQDFLSCSNYNNLSSFFLISFVGFLVSVCYIVVFVVVFTVLRCGMNMN